MEPAPRTVSHSRTTITELMIPAYANFGGKIHGGILLSLMDKVAYACASKHSGAYCVTVTVDKVEFLQPVEVGELVSLHASVNYVGNTSMIVGIRVEALDVRTNTTKHTNSSYFTMVAKGGDNKPVMVPKLLLETPDDVRRFAEAMKLKEVRVRMKQALDDAHEPISMADAPRALAHERCVICF